jgi:hypothetical protein
MEIKTKVRGGSSNSSCRVVSGLLGAAGGLFGHRAEPARLPLGRPQAFGAHAIASCRSQARATWPLDEQSCGHSAPIV